MRALASLTFALVGLCVAATGQTQDANVTVPVAELEAMLASEPLRIVSAEISRPKAKGDITLKAEVAFGERAPMRVKVRKAQPGAEAFNNNPRYDAAAYELQKLLMDPSEYVVPPTALRMIPVADFAQWSPNVRATFKGADDVLAVVQYWLKDIEVVTDVLDAAQFETDAVYARHIGQLNIFTYLINHRDSNVGNFLISAQRPGARVFSVDNGLAFASPDGDRGELWKAIRVSRLPADTVARLRGITENQLHERLGVLGQWELRDGRCVAVPPTGNVAQYRGVRLSGQTVQLGLDRSEINEIWRRMRRLLGRLDDGEIATF
jgi:hypothetical protein